MQLLSNTDILPDVARNASHLDLSELTLVDGRRRVLILLRAAVALRPEDRPISYELTDVGLAAIREDVA